MNNSVNGPMDDFLRSLNPPTTLGAVHDVVELEDEDFEANDAEVIEISSEHAAEDSETDVQEADVPPVHYFERVTCDVTGRTRHMVALMVWLVNTFSSEHIHKLELRQLTEPFSNVQFIIVLPARHNVGSINAMCRRRARRYSISSSLYADRRCVHRYQGPL